jgi:hypothetical protein
MVTVVNLRAPVGQVESKRGVGNGAVTSTPDDADHHMRMLMSPEGPFAAARDQNGDGDPLPYTAPPAGMFIDVRTLPS